MADLVFMRELKRWLRFNPRQALKTGDGLFSAVSGNPIAPTWLGSLLFDLTLRVLVETTTTLVGRDRRLCVGTRY